jgi:hypothetical protein
MSTKQQFSLQEFRWRYGSFPINKPSYSAVISLQCELTELFSKYLLELMPEYEVIRVDTKEKFENLQKFQERKIYLFDFIRISKETKLPEKFPLWEDIDKLDEIKFKIFLYDENTKKIPGALLTRADLILMGELRDYMSMFFSGVSFSVDREVVTYIIDKTEMMPSYYFIDTRIMARTFRMKVTVDRGVTA